MDPNTRALVMGAAGSGGEKIYVEDVFSTFLYTGNGSTQTITNGIDLSGKGGMVWIKSRSQASSDNNVSDTQRGDNATIKTNTTATQAVLSSSFGIQHLSTGFTVQGENNSFDGRNNSGVTYASWTFRKQAKFFDVVTYTGNATNRTIAHDLGSTPGCIIIKRTNAGGNWFVYHRGLSNPALDFINLNTTSAASTNFSAYWNSTAPTSTVFSLGTEADINANGGTYVAYLFAHDAGGFGDSGNESVVSCGSYTTNGSGVATITLGWEPQWLLVKRTDSIGSWFMVDTMRKWTAPPADNNYLQAESSAAETQGASVPGSVTSTGFSAFGVASASYIYIAIRRGPMKTPTVGTTVFEANGYTGNGAVSRSIATNFPIDLAFWTNRTGAGFSGTFVHDRLRGPQQRLQTSNLNAETNFLYGYEAFNTSTVTINSSGYNSGSIGTVIQWLFRRAPGFFDVVAYTGVSPGQSNYHNLGVIPDLIIGKSRTSGGYMDWNMWSPTGAGIPANTYLVLNSTAARNTFGIPSNFTATSTTFKSEDSYSGVTYIAYLFASCPGVSKVGSYTGTGTTLNIDCGFTNGARLVLIKRTDSTGDWYIWDTARGIIAANDPYLLLNSTAAEVTSTDYIDPLNSGFEISSTAPAAINANGGSFIYLAIA